MRISDLSSDVCSSDLTFPAEVKEAVVIFFRRCNRSLGHRERKPGITVGIDEQAAYDLERSASFGRRIKCDVEAPVELAPIVEVLGRERHRKFALNGLHRLEISGFEARYRETDQIGRASCRERGCKYV